MVLSSLINRLIIVGSVALLTLALQGCGGPDRGDQPTAAQLQQSAQKRTAGMSEIKGLTPAQQEGLKRYYQSGAPGAPPPGGGLPPGPPPKPGK